MNITNQPSNAAATVALVGVQQRKRFFPVSASSSFIPKLIRQVAHGEKLTTARWEKKIRGNTATLSINAELKGIDLISSKVPMPPDIAIALRSKRVLNVGSDACREKRITKRVIWRNAEEEFG